MTSGGIKNLLQNKYDGGSMASQYAFMTEVRDATGAMGQRYADAITMCLWPSQGLEIIGFEIKVARSDWLNELKEAMKSADHMVTRCLLSKFVNRRK